MLVCRQNTFKTYKTHLKSSGFQGNYRLILVIFLLSFFAVGCEENKSTQCQQMFRIAQNVKASNQLLGNANRQSPEIIKSWLQAANEFNRAADNLALLKINRSELIKYQNQLITLYRVYSQSTYDAVRARENQDLTALQSARQDAIKAGARQQKLIQEMNAYCLSN
jgi:ABC-type enterochelin transport system substrate-binding protein